MTDKQYAAAIKWLKRAAKGSEVYPWSFIAEGADGAPVFLLSNNIGKLNTAHMKARRSAEDNKYGRGELRRDSSGGLVLEHNEGNLPFAKIRRGITIVLPRDPALSTVKALLKNLPVVQPAPPRPAVEEPDGEVEIPDDRLETLRAREALFRADPGSVPDDKLERFAALVDDYDDDGEEDVSELLRAVEGEIEARRLVGLAKKHIRPFTTRLAEIQTEVHDAQGEVVDLSAQHTEVAQILDRMKTMRDTIATAARLD